MTFMTQPSFTGGEIAPALQSRIDLEKYQVALRTLRNMYATAHGGAVNRPGSLYIDEVDSSVKRHRLIPFIFSSTQAYALVFGDETLSFISYSGGTWGYVQAGGGGDYSIVSPYDELELADLCYVQSANVMYLTHPDYPPYKLTRVDDDDWTLEELDFGDGPYRPVESSDLELIIVPSYPTGTNVTITSSGSLFAAKHVGSPFRLGYANPDDPYDIQWYYGVIDQYTSSTIARMDIIGDVQLGYQMVINHEFEFGTYGWADASTSPGAIDFEISNKSLHLTMGATGLAEARQQLALKEGTQYLFAINIAAIEGSVRAKIGTTAGATDIATSTYTTTGIKYITFTATQEEIHIAVDNTGSVNGDDEYISYISVTANDRTTSHFRIGGWNSTDGFPRTVGIYEQRLIFGGTAYFPLTSWLSKTGDFENFSFSSPLTDDDSFAYRFDSGEVFDFQWILSTRKMIVGTSSQEWVVNGIDGSLTPTSIYANTDTRNGCAPGIPPIVANSTILYVQYGGKIVKAMGYSLENDGYTSSEVSILASHLFEDTTITEWSYSKQPDGIAWCVLGDGTMAGLTFLREHEIQGWHRHDTQGEYESVCTIPVDGVEHTLTIVKRNVDGSDVRYIEVFPSRITDEDTYDYCFLDCALKYDGAATTTITGLDHLEDEEVVALADGNVVTGLTVASGEIELDVAAELVYVGLAYTSDLETLGISLPDQRQGSSEGRMKSIPHCTIDFKKSRSAWIGPDVDHLDEVRFRDEDLAVGEDPIALFTGTKGVTFNSGYDLEGRVFIRNTDPVPITILSITPDVVISER